MEIYCSCKSQTFKLHSASLVQTGNNLQQDPTTHGSKLLNRIRLLNIGNSMRGRRQPLENTGFHYGHGYKQSAP